MYIVDTTYSLEWTMEVLEMKISSLLRHASNSLPLQASHLHSRPATHPSLLGVKHDAGHVVEVAAQSIDLPGLRVVHAPELDQAIIRTRDLRNAFGPLGLNHRRADI